MSNRERLPKLIEVHRGNLLGKRQLPLIVDETLTLVMDMKGVGIVCDNPLVRGKELEEFTRKWETLSEHELKSSLQITKTELMNVLNQNVPCVGCRRSVDRFYLELLRHGHPTLEPLVVKDDGTITILEEKQSEPQVLCSLFHNHAARLAKLIENQPKRNKKSVRCLLHSLDSQRARPLTPVWKDVWDCMRAECKKDVCMIDAHYLHVTLESYLRKHRFCGECRTKVLKDPEPCKEKGYVSSLYAGIRRCIPNKHIHLAQKTDYITKLINRAEPELLGSRRERHAKTLEIAQEEVLTCLGLCMYERLHRIYMRMREEECTCQVFAAVAVDTLSRSFQTAVERKQGYSQLELLYAELTREEQQKQIRKEQKKIKRKRKKGKTTEQDGKENCNDCEDDYDEKDDTDKDCSFSETNKSVLSCYDCEELLSSPHPHENPGLKCTADDPHHPEFDCQAKPEKTRFNMMSDLCECSCNTENTKDNKKNSYKCNGYLQPAHLFKKDNGTSSDHSHDCGYSSENNNGCCETGSLISSISSSPDGSELACSDTCCQNEIDCLSNGRYGHHQSLQEMLEGSSEDEDDNNCKLTPEEVSEFENNNKQLSQKRQELREALRKNFIDFCAYGPLRVPRLLVQTKYASN